MVTNGTMHSGTIACSSSGVDLGLLMSAMTKWDSPASNRTVSVKSLTSGLSKINTIGTKPRLRCSVRSRSNTVILWGSEPQFVTQGCVEAKGQEGNQNMGFDSLL